MQPRASHVSPGQRLEVRRSIHLETRCVLVIQEGDENRETWELNPADSVCRFTFFPSVCCLQSEEDIPILSEVSSGTKALRKQTVQREHWHARSRGVPLLMAREPFLHEHSLPNAVRLRLGETE